MVRSPVKFLPWGVVGLFVGIAVLTTAGLSSTDPPGYAISQAEFEALLMAKGADGKPLVYSLTIAPRTDAGGSVVAMRMDARWKAILSNGPHAKLAEVRGDPVGACHIMTPAVYRRLSDNAPVGDGSVRAYVLWARDRNPGLPVSTNWWDRLRQSNAGLAVLVAIPLVLIGMVVPATYNVIATGRIAAPRPPRPKKVKAAPAPEPKVEQSPRVAAPKLEPAVPVESAEQKAAREEEEHKKFSARKDDYYPVRREQ